MGEQQFEHELQVLERMRQMAGQDAFRNELVGEFECLLARARNAEAQSAAKSDQAGSEGAAIQASQREGQVESSARELEESRALVARLLEIGLALSSEKDPGHLMERILMEAKDLTNADGGTLYTRTADDTLKFEIIRSDTLGLALGGTSGAAITFPALSMYDAETQAPNHKNVASYCALTGQSVNISDAYEADGEFDFSGTKKFDEGTGYRSKSFLTVPMKNRSGVVLGVLQLLNARAQGGEEVVPFPADIETYVEALASQAAVALENRNLIESQKQLLDSFIELIAGAVDEKSPYTGGHCKRVPECAMMLARAACDSKSGPFVDFDFNEDEWYEFRIAGWLHDCGKVTTPEYVVDKATKLETIYNRINEIRMRFEVLLRDAEVEFWQALIEGGDRDVLTAALKEKRLEIADDFAFVAECNIGGEFMDAEKVDRLRQIAQRTWTRHLSDRLGLSREEMLRKERFPAAELPVVEHVLADREDHIIERIAGSDPYGENRYGFNMPVPEHEYNYGEIYNLSIPRGTLTDEERYKINHHIVQTILMLGQLPFPKHLERVPEYAGGHHEKMDGKGYPRGIVREQMSVPARIMAIADIFEALTASDRPYKSAKTLSESVRIMGFMAKDQHIDPELFRLFLESGVHLEYAQRFLAEAQIDEVDVPKQLAALEA